MNAELKRVGPTGNELDILITADPLTLNLVVETLLAAGNVPSTDRVAKAAAGNVVRLGQEIENVLKGCGMRWRE